MSAYKVPFRATLEASLKGLRELLAVLQEEQKALSGNDPESLEQIVKQKTALLLELESSVLAREQILQQCGLAKGLSGSEQFIRQHFTPDEILADWKSLITLSREVDELNTHNGKLALAGERTTRQAIGILTGRTTEPDTYNKRRNSGNRNGPGGSLGKC